MFIVTKKIDSDNISKLCRTCLREDGEKMVCLFVGPAGSSLAAKLRSLSCLEVWQGDGLPEKLCDRCVTRAESALVFREQCRAADRALRQAALKVSGITTYTTVAGCKLYQENRGLTPIESSQKTLKCSECGAVFMNYQELCAHSRLHAPFIQDSTSVQHMHIVESQNTYFNAEPSLNNPVIAENHNDSLAHLRNSVHTPETLEKNDRPACALHCSLCNHTFSNRIQLITHNYAHCNDNVDLSCDSIDIGEDSNEIAQNLSFQRDVVDISYSRNDSNTSINSMTFPENLTLPPNATADNTNVNDEMLQYTRFSRENLTNSDDFKLQTKENSSTKKHKCDVCGKLFVQKSKLKTHKLSHTGERPFKCTNCDKAYTSKSKLNAHMRLHTQTSVHQCNICEKTFSYPSYLLEHAKVHQTIIEDDVTVKVTKFECSICSKKFRFKKNLRAHVKFHSGNGLFHCGICDKAFGQKHNLKVHMRTHNGTKIHKCEYCEKCFTEKGNYTEHLRIHTHVKPFVCKLCGKTFAQSSHLKSHEASHNSTRPHQCRLCGKRFKLSSHLKRHTSLHTAAKSYKCLQCNQMFSQAFSLKRHLKRHSDAN